VLGLGGTLNARAIPEVKERGAAVNGPVGVAAAEGGDGAVSKAYVVASDLLAGGVLAGLDVVVCGHGSSVNLVDTAVNIVSGGEPRG
jgi:hypothetical protein